MVSASGRARILAAAVGALAALAAGGRDSAVAAAEPGLVKAQLLADVAGVQPGATFTVGVLLEMERGWHIYWKHPGDAGLPTAVNLRLPPGFSTVTGLQWPVPQRFAQPGGVAGFGYEGSVLLTQRVKAPEGLAAEGPVQVGADVSWLACKEACVPGSARLRLSLPVVESAAPAGAGLFAAWRERLPVDSGAPTSPLAFEVKGGIPPEAESGRIEIRIAWRVLPAAVDWFPDLPPWLAVEDVSIRTDGRTTLIAFTARVLKGQRLLVPAIESVVGYSDAKQVQRGVSLDIPLRPGA